MPCERCVNRREFLVRSAGVAAAAVACGDGFVSGPLSIQRLPRGQLPGKLTVKVSDFPGLATTGFLVQVGPFHAAKRTGTETFDTFSMACTHEGCLTEIESGQTFHCFCHGSNFTNTGAVINGPETGESIGPLQKLVNSYDPATDKLTIG